MSIHQAIAVKNGKIIETGSDNHINSIYTAIDKIDMKGGTLIPGIIDAHCHFYGYAKGLLECNLTGTHSWNEVVQKILEFHHENPRLPLNGRGWDQNDWPVQDYPDNRVLDSLFPDRPVILKRVDGHAVICNSKALNAAGITSSTTCEGGEIHKKGDRLTGILIDNAVDLVRNVMPGFSNEALCSAIEKAEQNCFSKGLTTLADAGLDIQTIQWLDSLQRKDRLRIGLYAMLNPDQSSLRFAGENGIYETQRLKVAGFKLYADGSLGSRGALLKKPYCDRPGHHGLQLQSIGYYEDWCRRIDSLGYQVNTHCIGDSANALILSAYGRILKGRNDKRWRIEHAQVLDGNDLHWFRDYSIVPSVQPTHATSDGPWAEQRICKDRMGGAYLYKTLLGANNYLPLGTDFPVESIDPLGTFFSAVHRQNILAPETGVFGKSESLTPEEAMKGMTIWAARACFLDHKKGSLKPGKDADFVILNTNWLNSTEEKLFESKVLLTVCMGNVVYKSGMFGKL
jgi:predicted amidohydrolase YtcJ